MTRHLPAESDDESTVAPVPRFRHRNDLMLGAVRIRDLLFQLRRGVENVLCLKTERELIRHLIMDRTVQIAGRLLPNRQSNTAIDRSNEESRPPIVSEARLQFALLVQTDQVDRVLRNALERRNSERSAPVLAADGGTVRPDD